MIQVVFKIMKNRVVFRVGSRREFGTRKEARKAGPVVLVKASADARVSLPAATGGFIENGTVDTGRNYVVRVSEVHS